MTGGEMERAIEFLLNSQASLEAQAEETSRQIAGTNRRLGSFAEARAEMIRATRQYFEERNRINAEQGRINSEGIADKEQTWAAINRLSEDREQAWAAISALAASQARNDERPRRTDDNLNRLAETVRLHVEGGNGNSGG